ncbi:MAG: hypothetical protein ACOYOF_16820 [Verrucomicrobiaceae bacterium]
MGNQGSKSSVTLTGGQWNAPFGTVFESHHDCRNRGRFRSPALNWYGQAVRQFYPGGNNRGLIPSSFVAVPGLSPNDLPPSAVPCAPRH